MVLLNCVISSSHIGKVAEPSSIPPNVINAARGFIPSFCMRNICNIKTQRIRKMPTTRSLPLFIARRLESNMYMKKANIPKRIDTNIACLSRAPNTSKNPKFKNIIE